LPFQWGGKKPEGKQSIWRWCSVSWKSKMETPWALREDAAVEYSEEEKLSESDEKVLRIG